MFKIAPGLWLPSYAPRLAGGYPGCCRVTRGTSTRSAALREIGCRSCTGGTGSPVSGIAFSAYKLSISGITNDDCDDCDGLNIDVIVQWTQNVGPNPPSTVTRCDYTGDFDEVCGGVCEGNNGNGIDRALLWLQGNQTGSTSQVRVVLGKAHPTDITTLLPGPRIEAFRLFSGARLPCRNWTADSPLVLPPPGFHTGSCVIGGIGGQTICDVSSMQVEISGVPDP